MAAENGRGVQAATKQFQTPLLMTQDMANILTPGTRAMCRQIDRVTVKGSTQPVGLFTYDVDVERLRVDWSDSMCVCLTSHLHTHTLNSCPPVTPPAWADDVRCVCVCVCVCVAVTASRRTPWRSRRLR